MIAPHGRRAVPRHPFLDSDGPLAFAHRGGAASGVENSMRAFQQAVDLGYRYLETDVHATADGYLVAFHDSTLDRMTDGHGAVARLPWSAVRRARIGGREPIPLLEEVLDAFPDVRVNIDVKADAAVAPLVAAIQRTGAWERVCVGSFSDARLAAVRAALGPRLATSLAPRAVAGLRLDSWTSPLPLGRALGGEALRSAVCAQVPVRQGVVTVVDAAFVRAAHRRGLQVHVWTIDDPVQMHRLLDLGVDGLMTDRLETLRDVLRQRGQWPS
ncbi:glycerophosphodiester phosphodiesterase [Allostreptomyces psammosilenae]|uniref:Glycerophosphoryl diester phosphodiesterase n=1 Tax=Allostreptomyces psammosilenae TaxID=1892865 RepID=A0A853A182_9ACTN|nr:glycerophosphodiester phosphodiesterase [Allostreptomyces psammosilenae]NYI04272.1 glycerophosphoryl diester phosphodiesterase [Allostreptomyces psammosilenae]